MKKHIGYWTLESCKKEASKHKTSSEFSKKSAGAYKACCKNGWLKECCKHMNVLWLKKWNIETCIEEIKKYNSRSEFKKNSSGAYSFCRKNNILDELCKHMKILGNNHKRLIYVQTFSDNSVYVGLTGNPNKRKNEHLNNELEAVKQHINKTGLYPVFELLTDYVDVEKAKKLEKSFVEYYKKLGFKILNRTKTGSIGFGVTKWTFDICKNEAKKYLTRSSFKKSNPKAYDVCCSNGWLKKCCKHMKYINRPSGYWNLEKCKNEALKYVTRSEFRLKNNSAYKACSEKGFLIQCCKHMKFLRKPKITK